MLFETKVCRTLSRLSEQILTAQGRKDSWNEWIILRILHTA